MQQLERQKGERERETERCFHDEEKIDQFTYAVFYVCYVWKEKESMFCCFTFHLLPYQTSIIDIPIQF